MIAKDEESDYVDPQSVRDEIAQARRLCSEHGWDMIDVTRRSIEETAATIIQMLSEHRDALLDAKSTAEPRRKGLTPRGGTDIWRLDPGVRQQRARQRCCAMPASRSR